ncbi:hypothetical protein GCM10022214_75170 [Actinomadura miaoliensis]|uniref:Uncharacterized protein n=1 Tax=Actinomadura miaoliensis TaxID=430685 RepID=A0ABP7WZP8_9ACTN
MLDATFPLGDNYWLVLGPIVIALALITWLLLLWYGQRKRVRIDRMHGRSAHRGAVTGGIIEGSPAQRTRRDEAERKS